MKTHQLIATLTVLLAACGGQAFVEQPDAGTGGGSVAGSGGSGGSVGGSGGSGGSVGGSGGSVGGSGGSHVGGSGGTVPECPPVGYCNWCDGENIYDDYTGCLLGYRCANGVDPCKTPPCQLSSECDEGEVCGPDSLCWPKTPGPKCSDMACSGGGGTPGGEQTCSCNWSCDGTNYEFNCKTTGNSIKCECDMDGSPGMACAIAAGSGDEPLDPCNDCCGFPKP